MAETEGSRGAAAPRVEALLDEARVPHRLVEHAPTTRALADAEVTGLPPARVAKTIVTLEHGTLRLAVIPASRHLDLRRMGDAVAARGGLRLATEEEVAEAFPGFEVGAIPPLGRLIGVEEVVDPLLLHEPEVLASAGDHAHGVLVDAGLLADAVGARVADISRHAHDDRRHRFSDAPLR